MPKQSICPELKEGSELMQGYAMEQASCERQIYFTEMLEWAANSQSGEVNCKWHTVPIWPPP